MQYALCNMQYAICNMQYAICNMQYAICNMQYAIYNMQYAICKGRVLSDGLNLNQCVLIETKLPQSQIGYPMCFHHQLKASWTQKGDLSISLAQRCMLSLTFLPISALSGWFMMWGLSCGTLR